MDLAPHASFRQALHVRSIGFVVALASASFAAAAPASNPAFLGIKMNNAGIGCAVEGITVGSAAQDAGLRPGDLVLALDGTQTTNCDILRNLIVANPPGYTVRLDIRRGGTRLTISAALSTRAEVLHRRLVGRAMDSTEVADVDVPGRSYDLGDRRGRTKVIGWFTLEKCLGCATVFDRISDGIAKRLRDAAPFVLGVTPTPGQGSPRSYSTARTGSARELYAFASTVPLAFAPADTFQELAIDDPERIHFMVIDCRGIVRFVAPIAPGSDDLDATVDEILAATEQAEHLRTLRR